MARLPCWGSHFTPAPSALVDSSGATIGNVVSVAIGLGHYCIAQKDGSVTCGGDNSYGQLGLGDTAAHSKPAKVPGLSGVVELSAGFTHTCARTSAGPLYCWGESDAGQLGLGSAIGQSMADSSATTVSSPTQVSSLRGVVEVAAGYDYTCVRLNTAQVQCFGQNEFGAIGDGTEVQRYAPVNVTGLP